MAAVHIDIPSQHELEQLIAVDTTPSVSLYLPTTPVTTDADAERIAFKNQLTQAEELLRERGVSREDIEAIVGPLAELDHDYGFWTRLARTLAVFATPSHSWLFRLPSELEPAVRVGERLDVKPLLRALTFPHTAFVLALSQGSCRLVEIAADAPPEVVTVPELPTGIASVTGTDRSPSDRMQGDEGLKVRMGQYARKVDAALRGVLTGHHRPLILAAARPIDDIFRRVNSYPNLLDATISGNPETLTDAELAERARPLLDAHYAAELAQLRERLDAWAARGRAAVEIGDVARAATFGAVDTLLVDIETHVAGTIDPETGAVELIDSDDDFAPGVADEIARRTLAAGGRIVAVRGVDMPADGPVAALLRYPV